MVNNVVLRLSFGLGGNLFRGQIFLLVTADKEVKQTIYRQVYFLHWASYFVFDKICNTLSFNLYIIFLGNFLA